MLNPREFDQLLNAVGLIVSGLHSWESDLSDDDRRECLEIVNENVQEALALLARQP